MDVKTVKAGILGLAAGDALGVPVEFKSRSKLAQDPVKDMRGYGTYNYPAGCWSDDTSMALCALEAFRYPDFSLDRVMLNFGRWYYKNEFTPTGEMFDVGNTCSYAIDNYFAYHKDCNHCGLSEEQDNGNGSLMRILPFSLFFGDDEDMIRKASALTHAHPRSQLACLIYTLIADRLVKGEKSKETVRAVISEAKEKYGSRREWQCYSRLEGIEKLPQEKIYSSGYVVDTLEAALWCLLTTDTYRDCVLTAVNLGSDTDTVAAVAGGLAGLLYGLESIPEEWLQTLKKRQMIEKLCEDAVKALKP